MPGSNFDNHLTIQGEEKRISPRGSLGEVLGSVVRRGGQVALHFWVVQLQDQRTGAFMQALADMPGDAPGTWTTRKESIHHHGKFKTGQAFATAVAISDALPAMEWWSETIRLTDPTDPMEKVSGA